MISWNENGLHVKLVNNMLLRNHKAFRLMIFYVNKGLDYVQRISA